MNTADRDFAAEFGRLLDEYRDRCLWYLRPDYHPVTQQERAAVLEQIRRHGDLDGFRRASALQTWLSHRSNGTSAGS